MTINCGLSRHVLDWLHADELDIALALLARDRNPYLVRSWEERPIWAAARDANVHKLNPVPLVTHPEGCEYRRRMTSRSAPRAATGASPIRTRNRRLQRAVSSGLGVTALTARRCSPTCES